MSRVERRQFNKSRAKRVDEYLRNNYFMRTGRKLFWKATGRSLDVQTLAQQFNPRTLAKHNHRIIVHPELTEADIEAEVIAMLFSKPGDLYYPVIRANNQRWQTWLGLNPNKGYYANLCNLIKALVKAGQTGLWEMCNYLFSTDIARRYGLNRGRINNKAVNQLVDDNIVHKGFTYADDEGNSTTDVKDNQAESFVDDTHHQMLLQQIFDMVTDPKDKTTLEIYYACLDSGTTIEKEHKRKLRKCQKLGLRTPASIRQRFNRIPQKYPEIRKLNPYR